ncbi:hypothetical protein Tco_0499302 [Tanacetum coccineum]
MADLIFADSHNMVAYLEKSEDNADFAEIVDFLNASPIRYALTVSPTVYVSYIEQFWSTAKIKTVNNETQIRAKVDGKTIVITESSVRRDLHFNDEDGITCLTNTEIFENLQLMGYEKLSDKLTFYKSFFSPQWKYLIHTILQCLSSKSTAWNEFGTNIASAVICLAKNQKFNFSKLIFDGMLRNLDPNSKKFLMYPRFLQLFLNNQIENLTTVFNDEYDTPSHTKKVFANMRRQGKDFSGTVTPLFATMLIQSQAVEGEGSGQPTEPQHTPTTASPSHVEPIPIVASSSHPKKTHRQRKTKRKATEIYQSNGPTTLVVDETVHEERGDSVKRAATTATSLDAEQGSGTGSSSGPKRQDTVGDKPAQTRVLDLENVKDAQALEIQKLKKRVKKLEKTQGRYGHDIGVNTASTSITAASINITTASAPITTADVSISTGEPSTPPPTTTTNLIEDEDLTIAQTLMKMKSEKSKAKGVTMQEPSESGTRRLQAELDEEARLEREREEEASKAANIAEWDDVQAMMDADYELATKLQEQEREELTIEERSKLFVELMNERKKHFARLRAEEQRRKPPTKTQKRNLMSTYLKNMAGYKHTQLKNKSFNKIQILFEKEMKRVNIFVDMDAELVKGSETQESEVERAVLELAAGSSKRYAEEELDQEFSKKQKTGESSELAEEPRVKEADELSQEELQQMMIIVPEKGMNVEALQTKHLIIDWEIYNEGTRKDDLVILWSLVKEKFNSTEPTYNKEREIWVNDSCGVHHVSTEKGIDIYMLVEKEYPFSGGTLTLMLVAKLLVDQDNEMSKELLRKIFMQAERPRR